MEKNYNHSYLLITPVKDEELFIQKMAESVLVQGILPTKWIIIDDGSTDRTPAILEKYRNEYSFIDIVTLPQKGKREPGGEGAIEKALKLVDVQDYNYIARFDADIVLAPEYIMGIFKEFDDDPKLGIAGGGLYILRNGQEYIERVPEYHVRGALKMYRQACFNDIGGLETEIGWDTIDEIRAWMHGWKTRSIFQYKGIHLRPTGNGVSRLRILWKRGEAEYNTCSHPLFVFLKSGKILLTTFNPVFFFSYISGFLYCYIKIAKRINNKEFIRVRREEQIKRIRENILSINRNNIVVDK